MYTKPKTIQAIRAAEDCVTCAILLEYGPESPVAMRLIAKRLGRPIIGAQWIAFLRDHEAYHLNKGEAVMSEICADAIPVELMLTVFAEAKPRVARVAVRPVVRPLTAEEQAAAEFEYAARPQVKQTNVRKDNRPVVKPLDTRAFGSFK